ncbi:MAG TPA: tyrosine-protein phosphatase [Chloroflexota bacterium]
MESTAVRVVDWIDGAVNLRDFGGYPTEDGRRVRSAVLFRSGATGAISRAGLARVADELRIRTVIDLRSEKERQRSLSPFEEHGIDVVHEPLDPGSGISPGAPSASLLARMAQGKLDWVELYWSLIQRNGDRFARIIDLLGRPGTLPVLIHCTGGRDRTGVTVALIQAALGISAANIAEDYALSSPLLELAPVAEFERLFGSFDIPREEIVRAMVTRPDTMHALFARVRGVYGDVDGLLRAIGLDREALDRLRAAVCA